VNPLKKLKFEVQLNYSNFEKSYELANSRESEYNFKKNNKLSDNYSSLKSVIKKESVDCFTNSA
jgi:hypothetical protein